MSKLIPLDQMPDQLGENTNIAWTLDAGPYINVDRYGFDVAAAQRLMRVGGIGAAIISAYQGEQSSIQVDGTSIMGLNSDGSATGTGSASVTKADTHEVDVMGLDQNRLYPARWGLARLAINRTELASRISDDVQRGHTRDDAWARQVDRVVRKGLVSAAAKVLVKEPLEHPVGWAGMFVHASVLTYILLAGSAVGAVMYTGLKQGLTYLTAAMANKRLYGDMDLRSIRLGLFPYGVQPDRLAIAALMGKTQRLIRPLPGATRG